MVSLFTLVCYDNSDKHNTIFFLIYTYGIKEFNIATYMLYHNVQLYLMKPSKNAFNVVTTYD